LRQLLRQIRHAGREHNFVQALTLWYCRATGMLGLFGGHSRLEGFSSFGGYVYSNYVYAKLY